MIMTIVVRVNDIFAVGDERCNQFGRDLNQMAPVKNLGELHSYSGCFYARDWEKELLKISQQTLAAQLLDKYGIEFGKSAPLSVGTRLAEVDKNEPPGKWSFR